MAASQDSSLLFSLKELEQMEEGRVTRDRADAAARREAERNVYLERERLAREAETRRLEEAERRLRAEEARRREEQARLEAIERAEMQRVRAEVEVRAQVELEQARTSHALAIEATKGRARLRTHRLLLALSVTAALMAGSFAVMASSALRERERLDAARTVVDAAERAQHERTLHALEASRALVDDLGRQLQGIRATALAAGRAPSPPAGTAPATLPPKSKFPAPSTTRPERACGLDGDPLNGCLPSR